MALPLPPQTDYGEPKEIPFAHAQVTAGFAAKLWKAPIAIEGGTATLPAGSGFVRYRPV